jgi:phospholipase C
VLPDVVPLRTNQSNENSWLSEFQAELVELASVLNGDYFLSSFTETQKKFSVKEADAYIKRAVSRYFQASKEAIRLGAHESAIVNMRPSLTSRNTNP